MDDGVPDVAAEKAVGATVPTTVAGATTVGLILAAPVYLLGKPAMPVLVSVSENVSVPALNFGVPVVALFVASDEVADENPVGRTEKESAEQAGVVAVKAVHADVVHSFITASRFL